MARAVSVGLVGLITAASVLVGVSPAAAADVPVGGWGFDTMVRLGAPSSVGAVATEATAVQRVTSMSRLTAGLGSLTYASSGQAAAVSAAGGPWTLGVNTFVATFAGTTQVMRWAGVPEEETGLTGLWSVVAGPPVYSPDFSPNSDVDAGNAPGWAGPAPWMRDYGGMASWSGSISDASTSSRSAVLRWDLTSRPAGTQNFWGRNSLYLVCRGNNEGVTGQVQVLVSLGANTLATFQQIDAQCVDANGGAGSTMYPTFVREAFYDPPDGSARVYWYPTGSPDRPADADTNPQRAWETRWTCQGQSSQFLRSAMFHEVDDVLPAYPDASCPSSAPMQEMSVWMVPLISGSFEPTEVKSWTIPAAQQDWQRDFPQCQTGDCSLELVRVLPDAGTVDCFAAPGACVDWWTQPEPLRSETYRCSYGGTAVAIEECAAYSTTFNVEEGVDVQTDGGPRPAGEILPLGDPATGQPVPRPASDGEPTAQPSDGTCPPPFSMTLGGLGYWVTKGVSCALSSAFVPTVSPQLRMQTITLALSSTAVGQIGTWFSELTPMAWVPTPGQCGVIVDVELSVLQDEPFVVTTCGGFWQDVGILRTLAGIAFEASSVLLGIRMVLKTIRIDSEVV